MRAIKTKVAVAAGVVAAGAAGFLVVGSAQADPTPDDPPIYADVKAPTSIPSDKVEGTGGVAFTPELRNTIEDPADDVTLTITLASADEGVDPQLVVTSKDDRCQTEGAKVTCHLDELGAGFTEEFALRLHVADPETWKEHPVTTFDAEMTGGATDTSHDSTYVYDARYDDVERIDFVLPDSIPNDMQPGTEGLAVRFQVNNDVGQELDGMTFTVDIKGLRGNEPSTIIGSKDDDCEATDTQLVCKVDSIAAGFSETFEARVWAGENFDGNYSSEVSTSVTWAPDGGEPRTFAQRTGYSHVNPYES